MISVIVPVIVTDDVPLPETELTPLLPAAIVRMPGVTDKVTVTSFPAASTSAIDRPVPCSVRLVCSVAL